MAKFLGIAQLADAAGLSVATVKRVMATGALSPDHRTPGGDACFRPDQVDAVRLRRAAKVRRAPVEVDATTWIRLKLARLRLRRLTPKPDV